jgi:alginate O-acetyltransferase complex protein AlgI
MGAYGLWLPLLGVPLLAWGLTSSAAGWIEMWALAVAIFAGLKWGTWWRARASTPTSWKRSLAYLCLWPGMDAPRFLRYDSRVPRPSAGEVLMASGCLALGIVLVWGVARLVPGRFPLLVGWVGLIGLAFVLHFGVFRLISVYWRSVGVDATPLMRAPIAAMSVREFWGKRWNTAFHVLARDLVVGPLRSRIGAGPAILAAFAASGLLHELVISVPARGGFGLPTAYFLLQAFALLIERSSAGKRFRLGSALRGRLFVILMSGVPALALFHPIFIRIVVLPFMRAVGAL